MVNLIVLNTEDISFEHRSYQIKTYKTVIVVPSIDIVGEDGANFIDVYHKQVTNDMDSSVIEHIYLYL